jgi:hypothetical protein
MNQKQNDNEIDSEIDILNQSLEALNIILEKDFHNNEEIFSKLIEVLQTKGKSNEAFFIPVQER